MGRLRLVFGLLAVGACAREPRAPREPDVTITLTWFFANGGDCADNRVEEVALRGNQIGSDAIVQRAPCTDGSVTFPPPGTRIAAGGWIFAAQALDAIGITCFDDVTTTLSLDEGEEQRHRLVFHKKTEGESGLCSDVFEDVDGGVPEPEPDAAPGVDGGGGPCNGCVEDGACRLGLSDDACGVDGTECVTCTGMCDPEGGDCGGQIEWFASMGCAQGSCFLEMWPNVYCCPGECDDAQGCL